MTRIHVLGGTGYAGSRIVREAARRGHQVVSFSRSIPTDQTPGVDYRAGDVQDQAFLASAFENTDVVISALSTHGGLAGEGRLRVLLSAAARLAAEQGVRLGVMGGAGSLLITQDGPRLVDTPDFPEVAKPESLELAGALDDLRANDDERLDWFLISPAENFGKHAPGTARGHYRVASDILLRDEHGVSEISGDDLALAIVDEIERPTHHRTRFSVAY
ncbi:NAD(P)-dependent oxidoreductase [Micrococcus luteus]|uniref:NAD(P)-dependent oxidoreductase n=1 Tax=Micrococcus luteus TaxID=1270 RepID=UPI0015D74848|nr:NAD(P)H-binding protein [Micrococcus luteus]